MKRVELNVDRLFVEVVKRFETSCLHGLLLQIPLVVSYKILVPVVVRLHVLVILVKVAQEVFRRYHVLVFDCDGRQLVLT